MLVCVLVCECAYVCVFVGVRAVAVGDSLDSEDDAELQDLTSSFQALLRAQKARRRQSSVPDLHETQREAVGGSERTRRDGSHGAVGLQGLASGRLADRSSREGLRVGRLARRGAPESESVESFSSDGEEVAEVGERSRGGEDSMEGEGSEEDAQTESGGEEVAQVKAVRRVVKGGQTVAAGRAREAVADGVGRRRRAERAVRQRDREAQPAPESRGDRAEMREVLELRAQVAILTDLLRTAL
eukprot:6206716-Pleurochrysis_carterae.AAC.2